MSLRLSPTEAEEARKAAWSRYTNLPNADLRVGRAKYEAEVAAINALEEPMDLKPCPHCGGDALIGPSLVDDNSSEQEDQIILSWSVNCSCTAFVGPWGTQAEAIAAWNRRDPKAQRLADALEGLIKTTMADGMGSAKPLAEARAALAEWKP